jgi:hypothetical protein
MSSSGSLSCSFGADYLQTCDCDYGCPCEFSAPPAPEHATRFIFRGTEVVSARELSVAAGTIHFQYSEKAAFVTEVHY